MTGNLSLKYYTGGHMFYAWEASHKAFFADVAKVCAAIIVEEGLILIAKLTICHN